MEYQDFKNPLITIPDKKVQYAIHDLIQSFPGCKGRTAQDNLPRECRIGIEIIHRYSEANIPVDYWYLDMDEDFKGDKSLAKVYNSVVSNMHKAYKNGTKLCLAGTHGVGKTMTCTCIIKKAVEVGYSGLYTTLTDIVNALSSRDAEMRTAARNLVLSVDFLVVDEFDPRFIGSDNASELFGRMLETTLRPRIHNRLPLMFCTNSPNVLTSFNGPLKQSITSLMKMVKVVPVLGSDFRDGGNK